MPNLTVIDTVDEITTAKNIAKLVEDELNSLVRPFGV